MKPQSTRKKPPARSTERRKGETVKPDNLLRLMEAVGPSRASRDLGVSTTTLHKAKKYDVVSKSIEIAAKAVLREHAGEISELAQIPASATATQRRNTTMFMLEVEPQQAEMVEKLADMLHAKLLRA